ncbi:MAG: phosphoenolpyruvate--protein phosphotransferase, partial [Lysobacterales bacterium]
MEIKKGIGVSPGVVISKAFVLDAEDFPIPERHIVAGTHQDEVSRLHDAISASKAEVIELRQRMADRVGEDTAAIFDFHLGMLEDQRLSGEIVDAIDKHRYTAEHAVSAVFRAHARKFLD